MVQAKLPSIKLSQKDIDRIAMRVIEFLHNDNKVDDDVYPLTMEEKAKQLGYSLSRFKQIYKSLGLDYRKYPSCRLVKFK